jgi:hypothetical protein
VQPAAQPPPELTALLQEELLRDERVLWQGQPDPKKHFAPGDLFLVPFSLLWGGFMMAIPFDVAGEEGANLFSFLAIVPFAAFGLYFIVGRFIYKAWRKRRALYAVTDTRVLLIQRGLRGPRFQAGFIDRIPSINRRVRRDGSGSVKFGNAPFWADWFENTGMEFMTGGSETPTFFDIPDANGVARLVNDLRRR